MYKDWNLEALSSSLRHFLSRDVNSQIATLANPQLTFRDIGLIEPLEAIRCSPRGQSKGVLCKLQTLLSKLLNQVYIVVAVLILLWVVVFKWKAVE